MDEEGDFNEDDEQAEGEEDELDPNNPDDAFAILERDFNKTYAVLEEDPNLSNYAEEFNKLFDFLYKTRVHALDLERDNSQLNDTLANTEDQLQTSLTIMRNDGETIRTLKQEVEDSHRLIDNAHAREQAAQEVIDNMRKQIAALTAEIDFKNKMAEGELEEDPQVLKHREGLEREKMKLVSEVQKLTEKFNSAVLYQEELEHRLQTSDTKITEIASQLEETTAEMEKYKRSRDKLEVELDEQKTEVEKKAEEITSLADTISTNQRMIAKYETQVKDHMASAMKCYKELEGWNSKYMKMQDEVEALIVNNDELKRDNVRIRQELKIKDEEKVRLNIDLTKLQKSKDQCENKIKHTEDERSNAIIDRNKLREVISIMEREIEGGKRQADADRRLIENTTRERDILNKNILRQQAVTRDHIKLIKVQEQMKRKLELEIDCHVIETRKHTKQISYLEKERDRLLEEELDLTRKIEDIMDDVKLKKNQIYELKKVVTESENTLRQQQNLYDAVRADRNALQKSLQEATAENHELKRKLKTTTHQTEQMKEDIAMKEQLLIKEETILRKISKEKENMKIELNVCWDQIRSLKQDILQRKDEEKRLHKVIVTSDRTIRDQVKVITQLMNERDVLGAQLVRRNDEIALLYEKIKILQTTLHRGEAQYEQRLQDIKLLKVEIKRLRQEKNLLTKSINNMNDLKQEIFHLERDLTKERLKTKALEDELQNPMNVHRWRKLEGSDPELYELLQKISLLQKRLLNQTNQTITTEKQLKETEKLYMNLRQVLSKQPGPGVLGELVKTQKKLTSNTNKMKCLVSELNLTEAQANEYKIKLEKVTEELNDVKRKLLHEKKEHARDLEALKEYTSAQNAELDVKPSKVTGGGFRFSTVRMPKTLEVCVDSFESAMAAIAGGATRLALCSSLTEGGLTPSAGMLTTIQNSNSGKIPVFCFIRCRPGNFVYTPEEMEVMKEDTKVLRKAGADGIIFGALLENGDVDMKNCREVVRTAFPLPLTFNRAFDFCKRPTIEIEVIIDLGFTRIETSGKQPNAQLGVKLIKKLMEQVGRRIIIMPAGGITTENLKFIMENTEASEYNGTFSKPKESKLTEAEDEEKIQLGTYEGHLHVTDQALVAQIVQILKSE